MSQIKKMRRGPRGNWALWVLLASALGFLFLMKLTDYGSIVKTITYSDFLHKIEQRQIASIKVDNQDVTGYLHDGSSFEVVVPPTFSDWERVQQSGAEVAVNAPMGMLWYIIFFVSLVTIPLVIAWVMIRQFRGQGMGGNGGIFNVGKSRARMYMPQQIKTRFSSVAGAAEAKEDLADVVDFLKYPEKYQRLGAKLPRGILLVGAPGNGKTLLAKAVAGEATCKFFSASGSDFMEVFVGVGAARVRDLFEQARRNAPSIIFIDEIDAVGRQRGSGLGGGNDEREQTLNQLLTEMDGFAEGDKTVVVLAATNRPEILDKALLRPGRFDRRVDVPYPDLKSREEILLVHARDVKLDGSVDLHKIALGTPGCTGADLQNLINEAAIEASKKGRSAVLVEDFEEARDRMFIGKRLSTIILSEDERKGTAYHEAGHAIINLLLPDVSDPLHKVTIIPRGNALGVTHSLPERDKHSRSRDEMIASIMIALGGRVAEEIVFSSVSTGASNDFQVASNIARLMVCHYGMSAAVGPILYEPRKHGFPYSEKTAELIDAEVHKIITDCYAKVVEMLNEKRDLLEKLAQALLERETLGAQEVYELLGIAPRISHALK